MKELIPWACSITSIAMVWLMGNKTIYGPIMGLISQFFWFAYLVIFWEDAWGLTPAVVAFTIVHIRNLIKWRKK